MNRIRVDFIAIITIYCSFSVNWILILFVWFVSVTSVCYELIYWTIFHGNEEIQLNYLLVKLLLSLQMQQSKFILKLSTVRWNNHQITLVVISERIKYKRELKLSEQGPRILFAPIFFLQILTNFALSMSV